MATAKETTITTLTPDPRNANKGTQRGTGMLEDSLRKYGAGRSILIDRTGKVIAGNKTLEQAASIGMEDIIIVETDGKKLVAVKRTDLDLSTDQRAKELAIADNRISQVSLDWDTDVLRGLKTEINLDPFFSPDELKALLGDTPAGGADPDAEDQQPNVPENPITQEGDVIVMGRHRLYCADSLNQENIHFLMNGARPDLVYNDPPYGVEVVNAKGQVSTGLPPGPALRDKVQGGQKNGSGKVGGDKAFGKVGTIDRGMKAKPIIAANIYPEIIGDDSPATAIAAYNICASMKIPIQIFWGANHYSSARIKGADGKEITWALPASSCWIVWDKDNGESFFADAELAWVNQSTAVRIFKHKWNGLIKASERNEKRCHPTQKPVALAKWCLENYGKKTDLNCLDMFSGSGSFLLACEQFGCACFAFELAPEYCDVIVTRWEKLTGKTAVRPVRENSHNPREQRTVAAV